MNRSSEVLTSTVQIHLHALKSMLTLINVSVDEAVLRITSGKRVIRTHPHLEYKVHLVDSGTSDT